MIEGTEAEKLRNRTYFSRLHDTDRCQVIWLNDFSCINVYEPIWTVIGTSLPSTVLKVFQSVKSED